MTRTMYDSVSANGVPTDGDLYAGYVNGNYPSYEGLVTRFPYKPILAISVDPSHPADILDCETGDATPEQCPDWAELCRSFGYVPCVYMNSSTWPSVEQQFMLQHINPPLWWVANYDDGPVVPPGAIAVQWRGDVHDAAGSNYDQSLVSDYWPGVDPPPFMIGDRMFSTMKDPNSASEYAVCIETGLFWHIPDTAHVSVVQSLPGYDGKGMQTPNATQWDTTLAMLGKTPTTEGR